VFGALCFRYRHVTEAFGVVCSHSKVLIEHKMWGKEQRKRGAATLMLCMVVLVGWSFTDTPSTSRQAAQWYDKQLQALQAQLGLLQKAARAGVPADSLRTMFGSSRVVYKRTELFIDLYTPTIARQLNGPDLLKIEDENPSDSLKPHGFQVLERILYTTPANCTSLVAELQYMSAVVRRLQTDPDRQYYFTPGTVWMAMRLSLFRLVSLGITGFDVPLSYHALPEAREVLHTLQQLSTPYATAMGDSVERQGVVLFRRADSFLRRNNQFNTFDRLTFIREYINPLSAWLTVLGTPYQRYAGIWPLSPSAPHIFARPSVKALSAWWQLPQLRLPSPDSMGS
jgi:cytochrome c peroxidase